MIGICSKSIIGNKSDKTIPKVIFRTYKDNLSDLNIQFKSIFEDVIRNNPDYMIVYLSDDDITFFTKTFFPAYLDPIVSLTPGNSTRQHVFQVAVIPSRCSLLTRESCNCIL